MKNDAHDGLGSPIVSEGSSKKPYTKPELMTYGTVETLTENSDVTGTITDRPMDSQRSK